MSLFGSLITGVSALASQAESISMISNNIANVNTVGYKRREAAFESLVTASAGAAKYSSGSVLARAVQKIDAQGALQQTNSTTDVAISGNGFLIVQKAPTGLQEKLFTRAGSFSEDANGYLRNTAGFYLMGWKLDENGQLPAGRDDISSTQAVNVSLLGGLTKATTAAEFSINLNAAESPSPYPIPANTAPDFKRTLKVFDSLGEGQNIEMQFTKVFTPTATATSSIGGSGATRPTLLTSITGMAVGDTINIAVGGYNSTYTVTSTSTMGNLIDFVNNDPDLQLHSVAQLSSTGQLQILARNYNETVAVTNGPVTNGLPGGANALGFSYNGADSHQTLLAPMTRAQVLNGTGTVVTGDSITVDVGSPILATSTITLLAGTTVQQLVTQLNTDLDGFARAELSADGEIKIISLNTNNAVATSGTLATKLGMTAAPATTPAQPTQFPDAGLAETPNAFGWWNLNLVDLDTNTILSSGMMNFNEDGTLNGQADIAGSKAVRLNNINWGNGSALQNINFEIGALTQFSGEYNVTAVTQNGAELGLRTGIEIDGDGVVTARFSNGQTSALFQLPLATFTNVNGLGEESGNAYIQTAESGSYNLRAAGDGGAGQVEGSAVETSNVDIADEFTKMIVTQRSYSAATKIIQTADQMTEELLRLR